MMLNKIPVLDKGYVALIDSSVNSRLMRALEKEHFQDKINSRLWDVAHLTVQIRCPVFVQLFLQQADLTVINTVEEEVECYVPDLSEINTGDPNVDREISEYIRQTSEALLLTAKGFEKDKLDRFTSHSLIPVSVYNTVVVGGSLRNWISIVKRKSLPNPIEAYRSTIYDIMLSEWKELDTFIGRKHAEKKEKKRTAKAQD